MLLIISPAELKINVCALAGLVLLLMIAASGLRPESIYQGF